MLGQDDRNWLTEQGFVFEDSQEPGGLTNVIIKDYRLPAGFDRETVDLLMRLPSGFPDAAPDMFWVDPQIRLVKTGDLPPATNHNETHVDRIWQRFSRHFVGGAWRPGIDSLQSWVLTIRTLLERDVAA